MAFLRHKAAWVCRQQQSSVFELVSPDSADLTAVKTDAFVSYSPVTGHNIQVQHKQKSNVVSITNLFQNFF